MGNLTINQKWDLNNFFSNRQRSLQLFVQMTQRELEKNDCQLINIVDRKCEVDSKDILNFLQQLNQIKMNLTEASSYIACLASDIGLDEHMKAIQAQIITLQYKYDSQLNKFQNELSKLPLVQWEELLNTNNLREFTFILSEWRREKEPNLASSTTELLNRLTVDGYHAWGDLYKIAMASLYVELPLQGEVKKYSIGQALNLRTHQDEHVRKLAHDALESKWSEHQDLFAKILNHIAGFRLEAYKVQGIHDVLQEPLIKNRMKQETLNAMWSVIRKNKQPFVNYLNHKAKLQGHSKMQSYNFWASDFSVGNKMNYTSAIQLVKKSFREFGSRYESFIQKAIEEGWIESENRAKNSAVAFCSNFPLSRQSRIFLTFDGSYKSLLTLIHEIGHAFHNFAMKDVASFNQQYPLTIAETASTFSELYFLEGALNTCSQLEKINLLDEKLKKSVMNFMNIHSRFLFEQSFYEERKNGFVSPDRLNELMKEAISVGYADAQENTSQFSWIWTPHFYFTKAPFYNFQYTFGYLLSLSLLAKSKELGANFEEAYIQLLEDSGKMTIEDLILKHLNEDITTEAFWEKGMQMSINDVELFIQLTD